MHAWERHRATLQVLAERGFVSVQQLTQILASSEATVRRDLGVLEKSGQLRRIRGGAEPCGQTPTALRGQPSFASAHGQRLLEKRAIGAAAATLVPSEASIIVDGGSTTFAMVEFLTDHEIRVLTPSFPVAEALLRTTRAEVLIPGGALYREQQLILSPFEEPVIDNFWAQTLFVGAQAIGPRGVQQSDPLLVRAQRRLIERAERVVVLADASKFDARASLTVCALDRVALLVTDERADPAALERLRAEGVEVMLAPLERTSKRRR